MHARRDDELELWKFAERLSRQGRSFAYHDDHVEFMKALHEGIAFMDMIVKEGDVEAVP